MRASITQYIAILCVGVGISLALAAPDLFAEQYDAAPQVTSAPEPAAALAPLEEVASELVTPEDDPTPAGVAEQLQGGHYVLAVGGAVWLLLGLLGRVWRPSSRVAKVALAAAVAGLGAAGLALYHGAPLGWDVVTVALAAVWSSAGVHEHVRDLIGA